MAIRVRNNGFGRIGRQVYRAMPTYYADEVDGVAVNRGQHSSLFEPQLGVDSLVTSPPKIGLTSTFRRRSAP